MDSDEDLPAVILNSPVKRNRRMRSQRRNQSEDSNVDATTKLDLDAILSRSKKKIVMPDAAVLAEERKRESDQNEVIQSILQKDNKSRLSELKRSLSTDFNDAGLISQESRILSVCPGVQFREIDLSHLNDYLCEIRINYMKNIFETLQTSDETQFEDCLNMVLEEVAKVVLSDSEIMKFEDILCHIFLICCLLLETRCRIIHSTVHKAEILWALFKRIPPEIQTPIMIDMLTQKLLLVFEHFHNRLCLAEYLERLKCNPVDIDTVPAYFSTRLCKSILHHTLYEIVGYKSEKPAETRDSFISLRKVIRNGKHTKSLDAYQQYIVINILNKLNGMIPTCDEKNGNKETKARKWFLTYFSSLKCHQTNQSSMNTDFFKLKALCACSSLLWQGQLGEEEISSQDK